MSSIRFDHVDKLYGNTLAVDDVSFTLEPGEILALLGASGCGKTTTLRLIAGLERPNSGEIFLSDTLVAGGNSAWVQPEHRRVGFVFQDYALFPHLSVAQNVTFGLKDYRGDKSARAEAMLDLVGLDGLGKRMPHQLSGGQQQRVALARALAPEPDVLLLDEPFSNLDAALRNQVRGEVRDILRATGVTSVFVTHDQEEALSIADRVAVMRGGRVEQIDAPMALYLRPATRSVAAFVGEANFIPAEAGGAVARGKLGAVLLADPTTGPVDLMIRPEAIEISPSQEADANERVPAEVTSVEFFGHDQRVSLCLEDDTPLIARLDSWERFEPGQPVTIRVVRPVQAFPRETVATKG